MFNNVVIMVMHMKIISWILIIIVSAEILLRGFAYFLTLNQKRANSNYENKSVILTLGESTTADQTAKNGRSWPRILEEKIKAHCPEIKIVNVARPAITTTAVLKELQENLIKYRPVLVISMMGINDMGFLKLARSGLTSHSESFWNLRVSKLFSLLSNFVRSIGSKKEYPLFRYSEEQLKIYEKATIDVHHLIGSNTKVPLRDLHPQLDKLAQTSTDDFYRHAVYRAFASFQRARKETEHYHYDYLYTLLKAAKMDSRFVETSINYSHYALEEKSLSYCSDFVKVLLEKRAEFATEEVTRYYECFTRHLDNMSNEEKILFSNFKKAMGGTYEFNPKINFEVREKNYLKILDILSQSQTDWLVMQYPTRDIEELKNILASKLKETKGINVRFLENKENFDTLLSKHPYDEIFVDRFGQSFGHATFLGNEAIATNAARELTSGVYKQLNEHCTFSK